MKIKKDISEYFEWIKMYMEFQKDKKTNREWIWYGKK